jgi:agmatinase
MIQPAHRRLWSGLASDDTNAEIGILGIPFDGATSFRKGASFAPSRIRELTPHASPSTEEGISLAGLRVRDYGDVFVDLDWKRYFKTVEARAQQVLSHSLAIFLGGDHSVTIPLAQAFSTAVNGRFGMLHIDAHLDLADSFEGSRWSHACTQRRVLELPNIDPRHLAFVGIRSFMDDESEFLAGYPEIGVHTARDVYVQGIDDVARSVVNQLQDVDAVYVTLDIDALDPAFAPGTGTPEAGGLSTRDVLELLRLVFSDLPVRALDIVEVSPPLDHSDITSVVALKVIYQVFGWVKANAQQVNHTIPKGPHHL